MNLQPYLQRINYSGPLDPTVEVLSALQLEHLMHVPFENLDIHNNTRIDLANLFDKIVNRNRGGFCYELNGLFYELLKEIGFNVKMVSARVFNDEKKYSSEFDHMALIVKIKDEEFLTDVGFGEFSSYPIKINLDKEVHDPAGIFKIEKFDDHYKVIKKRSPEGEFIPEYIFSEKERQINEFGDMCNWHQTNKGSHFMKKKDLFLTHKERQDNLNRRYPQNNHEWRGEREEIKK